MILMIGLSRLLILGLSYSHQKGKVNLLSEQNVLRLQIAMYDSSLVEKTETSEELLCKNSNQGCAETSKLILLDQFVQVDT